MDSPPLLLTPVLPTTMSPTTANVLTRHHRERLMRSTRKLGAVLGTTPFVVEPGSDRTDDSDHDRSPRPPTRSSSLTAVSSRSKSKSRYPPRRQNSLMTTHSRSSTSSFEIVPIPGKVSSPISSPIKLTKTPSQRSNQPRQLTLYLNTALANSPDSNLRPPRSPSFISITTAPPSPTPSIVPTPSPDVVRRRKMAKLKRTLGENVPIELVFGKNEARRSPSRASRPKGQSPSKTSPPPPLPQLVVTTTTASTSPVNPPPAFPSMFSRRPRRPGSAAPFSERHTHAKQGVVGSEDPVKIKASDWSGEWNVGDIRKVQQGLRALRKS